MKNVKDITALVVDNGLFVDLACKLGETNRIFPGMM